MTNLNIENPFTSDKISTVNFTSKKDALQILTKAHTLHTKNPSGISKEKRIKILENLHLLLLKNKNKLIELSVSEGGKPIQDTKLEMNRALEGVKLGIQAVRNIKGEMIPMNLNSASEKKLAYTQKKPIGVVLSISAFNHPINLAIHQIIPCIAAGCPVIYKPALSTPLTSKEIINSIYEAGLPKEWCTYLICDNETTSILAQSDLLGYISFIGSSEIGWSIKQKMAPGVRIVLEHGGIAPVVVAKDANLNNAVPQIVKAGFYHAGQVCVSAQRIFVHEEIIDKFISQLNLQAQVQKVGNPKSENSLIGPVISKTALDRIDEWVQLAINEGATLICGGNKLQNNCYEPTVLLNPNKNSLVSKEEIFGPVICVYSFKKINEAIQLANNSPYIFQSAVYTNSINSALKFTETLNGTAVMINTHPAFRVDWMPFGGQGLSGEGLGGIEYSVHEMLKKKLIVIHQD